jgi:uncharacterized membrane protein
MTTALRRFAFALGLTVATSLAAAARAETWTTIDYPGASLSEALGINERGDVVGRWADADGDIHGFLLRHGRFTSLDVPGATFTAALDINNLGVVGGRYFDADGVSRGFTWKDGRFTQIDFPVPWTLAFGGSTTSDA